MNNATAELFNRALGDDAWEPRAFKSLAQIEKIMKEKELGDIPKAMIDKPVGYTLVEVGDSRTEASAAADAFASVVQPDFIE